MLYQSGLEISIAGMIGNVETAKHKNITFYCWDVGGQEKLRPLWRHYYQDCKGFIFMIDSNDRDRLCMPFWIKHDKVRLLTNGYLRKEQEILCKSNINIPSSLYSIISEYCQGDENSYDPSRNITVEFEIKHLLNEEDLNDVPLLIFANKQDLPNALSVDEIEQKLELEKILSDRKWHIQSCSASQGDGLKEGLKWLRDTLSKKKK